MHTKRLFLQDLTDWHLTLMLKGVRWSNGASVEEWLASLQDGTLAIFQLEEHGIIGLRRQPTCIFVEFLSGTGLRPYTQEIVDWLKTTADGRCIEAMVTRPGLVKYYTALGFRPLSTWMRFDYGRK